MASPRRESDVSAGSNPLLSSSPHAWERLIESVDPASLLVVIEHRMGAELKNACTAEDIFQEALLHAWRDRHHCEWRGAKSFRSWVLSIIDHRIHDAADRLKAAKRSNGKPVVLFSALGAGTASASAEPDLPARSTTPSRLASAREQAAIMRSALDSLPEELREVARLRLFEQRPLEEIAQSLGLGISAVRHRFRKASELYAQRLRAPLAGPRLARESEADFAPEPSP